MRYFIRPAEGNRLCNINHTADVDDDDDDDDDDDKDEHYNCCFIIITVDKEGE